MRPRLRLPHALAAGACALALVAAGCGGGDDDNGGGGATAPAATTGGGETVAVDGKQVFSENCASCHMLADADSSGSFGTNLDEAKPDAASVEAIVKSGKGGMPAFAGQLSDAEIAAVAAYVAETAGQ